MRTIRISQFSMYRFNRGRRIGRWCSAEELELSFVVQSGVPRRRSLLLIQVPRQSIGLIRCLAQVGRVSSSYPFAWIAGVRESV